MVTEGLAPFSGVTKASQTLDAFVMTHAATAFAFASAMVCYPGCFRLFIERPEEFTGLAEDSIRWASPFVFGFSGLAYLSLHMPPLIRCQIAKLYSCCFLLASVVGIAIQTTGRWNAYHPLNIVLFCSLAAIYSIFCYFFPQAFSRQAPQHETLTLLE